MEGKIGQKNRSVTYLISRKKKIPSNLTGPCQHLLKLTFKERKMDRVTYGVVFSLFG